MWWLYFIGLVLANVCVLWVLRVGEREVFIYHDTEKDVVHRVHEAMLNLWMLFGLVSWVMIGGIFNWWDL